MTEQNKILKLPNINDLVLRKEVKMNDVYYRHYELKNKNYYELDYFIVITDDNGNTIECVLNTDHINTYQTIYQPLLNFYILDFVDGEFDQEFLYKVFNDYSDNFNMDYVENDGRLDVYSQTMKNDLFQFVRSLGYIHYTELFFLMFDENKFETDDNDVNELNLEKTEKTLDEYLNVRYEKY